MAVPTENSKRDKLSSDFLTLGIAAAAIILFVGTGGAVMATFVRYLMGEGPLPDQLAINALLLNIALILLGWRRYRELTSEITTHREAEARARSLAEIDPLTSCLNRRSMEQSTEAMRKRANAQGKAIAYVMLDVDNFKQINDMNGHVVGDAVLSTLADRIRHSLPSDSLIARLGGDEFSLVIAFDPARQDSVDDQIIRLFEVLSRPFNVEDQAIDVTISIGVATDQFDLGDAADVTETLMHRADIAMYHSKKQGKNRYFWFEPSMESDLRFRIELEKGIRNGIANSEFVPFYEQQVDLDSGTLVGFEMLARWKSPELGMVSPEIFIPIAEEIGVIGELSEQLMAQAFEDAKTWDPEITLSVNISPVQMRDPWFAQKLLKQLTQHDFPASRLEIEITESCLHQNVGMVRSMIASLRNQGVKVSLDDFGTGYSSLEQLRALPFDRIKIDRSFVSELRNPQNGTGLVDAIVSLGQGLQMPITAEGIEDETILRALQAMGTLKGQGYFYGKPESSQQVKERLEKNGRMLLQAKPSSAQNRRSDQIGQEMLQRPAE